MCNLLLTSHTCLCEDVIQALEPHTPHPSSIYLPIIHSRRWRCTWLLATVMGGMGGVFVLQVLQTLGPLLGVFEFVTSVVALFAPGLAMGWMQARTFPYALDIHRRWWVATALGSAIAPFLLVLLAGVTTLGNLAAVLNTAPLTWLLAMGVVGGATFGVAVGACQAVVLRGYARRPGRWVLASGAGGVLATMMTVWGVGMFPPLLLVVCMFVVYATVTGIVFPLLLTAPSADDRR